MFMRRRPLMRAAVVGGGAYVAGKRSAQRSAQQADQNEQQAAPAQSPAAGATSSMTEQLDQLGAMHDQGTLTDSEFATAKAKLLGS
jgi:Short C-terminal domain